MESTLALKRTDFMAKVGFFLGFGRGTDKGDPEWTDYQESLIEELLSSGLRQFYNPPPIDSSGVSYDWSFLHPSESFALASGASELELPDDFGGFEGRIVLSSSVARPFAAVDLINPGVVRLRRAQDPDATGQPEVAGLEWPKNVKPDGGQRAKLLFWPTADQAYTLQFQYFFLPEALTGNSPWAYGGMQHSETIVASCKYAAERDLDDVADGPQKAYFFERLKTSISLDRRNKPQHMGLNRDRSDDSDGRPFDRRRVYDNETATTFNGLVSN